MRFFSNLNSPDNGFRDLAWGALDDVVMGGVSESTFIIDTTGGEKGGPAGLFKGLSVVKHSFLIQYFSNILFIYVFLFIFSLSYTRHVYIASGVVSTTNNGGFTSIRTKVIIRILS